MLKGLNDIKKDTRVECDVCIIGSGAGGAPVAARLAKAGLNVVILEEGGRFDETFFDRNPARMMAAMYKEQGVTATIGQPVIPLPLGRTLGGSTTINSGTCFRTPDSVLDQWSDELALKDIRPAQMAGYFDEVEERIDVKPVPLDYIGGSGHMVRKGAIKLGWSHKPLARNARDCTGCGVCAFGCVSGAKKSMDKNYLPDAEEAGARIFINCRADGIETSVLADKRVHGYFIDADENPGPAISVNAKVVIVAASAIFSPLLLKRSKLGLSSGWLGRNLRIHPGIRVAALFDEELYGWHGVPQSYCIDEFADQGIMLEGVFVPPSIGIPALPYVGRRSQELAENYKHIAFYGAMIADKTEGRVYEGRPHKSLMVYQPIKRDVRLAFEGICRTVELFFAAGARRVFPAIAGYPEVKSLAEFEKINPKKIRADKIEMMAFHPMGTARAGGYKGDAVVDSNLEVYDAPGVFVADASIFPSCLGVNPQESIMAFSLRLGDYLDSNRARYFSRPG